MEISSEQLQKKEAVTGAGLVQGSACAQMQSP
jgi:hypothetical protein